MTPLKAERTVLTWLCICPPADNTGRLQKRIYAVFSCTVVIAISSNVIGSLAYFRKFLSIDFESALDGLHPILGWTPLIFIFIVMHLLKHRIVELLDDLTNIYRKRELTE